MVKPNVLFLDSGNGSSFVNHGVARIAAKAECPVVPKGSGALLAKAQNADLIVMQYNDSPVGIEKGDFRLLSDLETVQAKLLLFAENRDHLWDRLDELEMDPNRVYKITSSDKWETQLSKRIDKWVARHAKSESKSEYLDLAKRTFVIALGGLPTTLFLLWLENR